MVTRVYSKVEVDDAATWGSDSIAFVVSSSRALSQFLLSVQPMYIFEDVIMSRCSMSLCSIRRRQERPDGT